MQTSSVNSVREQSPALLSALLLLGAALCSVLSSPKWTIPAAAWLGPVFLLYYFQHTKTRRKWLWFLIATVPANCLALFDVMPFPWFVMVGVLLFDGLKTLLLFALHRWLVGKQTGFGWTLVFPALWTVREFIETRGDIGTFASVANTQYAFPWLVQLVCVTGLWGITFLIYWFASVAVWVWQARQAGHSYQLGVTLYGLVLASVMTFGAFRYHTNAVPDAPRLAVGGVTVPNLHIIEALYEDETGRAVRIDPHLAPASAALQEAKKGLISFIQDPSERFRHGRKAIQQQQDSLFRLSTQAVRKGAKLVLWSEGSAMLLKADEPALLARGQVFAAQHRVYLLMAVAVIQPGPLQQKDGSVRPFLENKTVLIDPTGQILNVFHKNHPVPMAEPTQPGDGQIPAIASPHGTFAPSICYDAEHTATMQQLGQKRIGLLLLPSGDWQAIAPYHSYMAVFRAVENGCSLARQVSGGLSVFTDYRGRILASRDDYAPGTNLTVVNLPVRSVPTFYARFGDWLAYANMGLLVSFGLLALVRLFRKRQRPPFGVGERIAGEQKTHMPA